MKLLPAANMPKGWKRFRKMPGCLVFVDHGQIVAARRLSDRWRESIGNYPAWEWKWKFVRTEPMHEVKGK